MWREVQIVDQIVSIVLTGPAPNGYARYVHTPGVNVVSQVTEAPLVFIPGGGEVGPQSALDMHFNAQCFPLPMGSCISHDGVAVTPAGVSSGQGVLLEQAAAHQCPLIFATVRLSSSGRQACVKGSW